MRDAAEAENELRDRLTYLLNWPPYGCSIALPPADEYRKYCEAEELRLNNYLRQLIQHADQLAPLFQRIANANSWL